MAGPAKEHALTRKIGPLPAWAWVSVIGGVILLWAWWERRNSTSTTASSTTASDTTPPEVIQTTPPTINITNPGSSPTTHHSRAGTRQVSVPDVIGQQYETGSKKVSSAGLTPQRSSPFVGKVTRESPSAGSKVARGTTVTLSGHPWPQTQFRKKPTPNPGGPDQTGHGHGPDKKKPKPNPGGPDKTGKKKAPDKKRRKPKPAGWS